MVSLEPSRLNGVVGEGRPCAFLRFVGCGTSSSSSASRASLLGAGVRLWLTLEGPLWADFFFGDPIGREVVPSSLRAPFVDGGESVDRFWKKPRIDFWLFDDKVELDFLKEGVVEGSVLMTDPAIIVI